VPADPDQTTLMGYLLAFIGLGGGGAKFVTHESRLSRLEKDRAHDIEANEKRFTQHDSKLDDVKDDLNMLGRTVSGMDAKLDVLVKALARGD